MYNKLIHIICKIILQVAEKVDLEKVSLHLLYC